MTAELHKPIERRGGADRRASGRGRPSTAAVDPERAPQTALELLVEGSAEGNPLREVAQTLSHQLRTPLTTIYSGSKLLSRHAPRLSDSLVQEVTAAMEADAERLLRIVEDLVVAAALPGEPAIRGEPVLLQRLLPVVAREAQHRLPGFAVVASLQGQMPAVRADEVYLRQVLRNLIDNAAQYGPDAGRIVVHATSGNDRAEIHVLDDGPGVHAEEAERVFTLFAGPGTPSQKGGLGLGLFVCRRLIELMDGHVWVAGRDGGGSDFAFDLPLYPVDDR